MTKVVVVLLLAVVAVSVVSLPQQAEAAGGCGDGLLLSTLNMIWQIAIFPIKVVCWVMGKIF